MSLETEMAKLRSEIERHQSEIEILRSEIKSRGERADHLYESNAKLTKQNKALWDYTYELCRSHQILQSLVDKLIVNASPWRKAILTFILSAKTMNEIQKEISVSQYQDAVAAQYKDLIQ